MARRRLHTALGCVAIVLAASAAALANSAAFSIGGDDGQSAVPIDGLSTVPEASVVADGSRLRAFEAGAAGLVVLRVDGRDLEVVSVRPDPGWRIVDTDGGDEGGVARIGVILRSARDVVEFEALLVGAELVTRIEVAPIASTSPTPSPSPSVPSATDDGVPADAGENEDSEPAGGERPESGDGEHSEVDHD
jgi:hypothetical protein